MKNAIKGFALLLLFAHLIVLSACTKEDNLIIDPEPETPTCSDGIQNGDETGVDCGGSCDPCTVAPTCSDGIQNGDETGVDCGGSCDPCTAIPTCSDGIQNGDETGIDCGGSCDPCTTAPTCSDGIQNGDETGVDCGGSDCPPCVSTVSMLEHIASKPQFSMLNEAIERANFASNLEGMGPYTFFAPNNDAWQGFLSNNGWTSIDQASSAVLNTVLQFHISTAGTYTSDQFTNNFQITIMFQSKQIHIDLSDPNNPKVVAGLTAAGIVGPDQMGTNGVVHEIDNVILF